MLYTGNEYKFVNQLYLNKIKLIIQKKKKTNTLTLMLKFLASGWHVRISRFTCLLPGNAPFVPFFISPFSEL